MALDFSQVVGITIPQGGVKRITINGTTVWEEPVAKTLVSISLNPSSGSSAPTTSTWTYTGTVTATYSDGTTANVTSGTTYTQPDRLVYGQQSITFSYTEDGVTKTAVYTMSVSHGWVTLESGSHGRSWTMSDSAPSNSTVLDMENPKAGQYRFTFTMSDKVGTNGKYYNNGSETTTKPTSPITITISDFSSTRDSLLGVGGAGVFGTNQKTLKLRWYKSSILGIQKHEFQIYATAPSSGGATSGTISLFTSMVEYYV